MSSAHNASITQNSSWSNIPVSRVFGQRSTELCGGFPHSPSQLLHTSGHFQQHDISVKSTVPFEWSFMSFPNFSLYINTNYFNPKNLGKLFHWTGASFLYQHVNLTPFPEWPCHSGSSATLNFQRCEDSTKSDHLGGVVCISRVFPDSQIITAVSLI